MRQILVCLAVVASVLSAPPPRTPPKLPPQGSAGPDAEIEMNPAEIINRWGYTVEEYDVETADNYTLKLYRIPFGKSGPGTGIPNAKRPVVFLQHGFETSSADWVINLPTQSAGFMFADAGFDVWLGNFRGTRYSQKHAQWDTTTHFFWRFSITDMALKDLPTMLDKVRAVTNYQKGDRFYLIAHSTGATAAFIYFSQVPAAQTQITQFYALAPVIPQRTATSTNVQGPLKFAAPFAEYQNVVSDFYGMDKYEPNKELRDSWASYVCQDPETELTCRNVLLMISGPDTRQMNVTRMPVINAHSPAGTSVKAAVQLAQWINKGELRDYDYGHPRINQQHYPSQMPPLFILSNLQGPPTFLYSGGSDWIARPEDIFNLAMSIGRAKAKEPDSVPSFNHIDFLWGNKAARSVYQPIMQSIGRSGTNG